MKHARHLLLMVATLLCSFAVSAENITDVSQLSNTKLYFVSQPGHASGTPTSWIVTDGGSMMTVNNQLGVGSNNADVCQQFAFISNDGGATYYLYHPAEEKFVNKDGSLGDLPIDAVSFTAGNQGGTFVIYFDASHVINTNDNDGLIINRWGPLSGWGMADAGNSCAITPVGEFDPADALAMFAAAEEEKKKIIEFSRGANGWIDGSEWYDQTMKIVGYTSPLYRFAGKVETFHITVPLTKGNTKYFCLSELELYDADGNKIALSASNVASNADHNTLNPNAPDGGGFAALFDENTGTYFHSAWRNMPAEDHYLEITLPDGGYDAFSFKMLSRAYSTENNTINDQSHTFPGEMVITTSVPLESTELPGTPGDEPAGPVTDLAAADPTKCYTISTNGRGAWAVDAEGTRFSTTGVEGFNVDAADVRQQFAILSANARDYYLYSVSAKKFVKQDRSLVVGAGDAIEFVDASSQGAGRVMVRFRDIANANINIGGDNQMIINSWGIIDAGNAVLIAEAGDFDAAEALIQLTDPDAAELNALIARIEALVEANATNHAVEPALGQYSTAAYEALAAAVGADSVSKASLEAAIATFEAAKCLPVFSVDGVYGYAAGMSIYELDAVLHWKETDRTDESMLWTFDMTDTVVGVTDRVVVKNLATGNYFDNTFFVKVTETEEAIIDDGLFLIYPEGMGYPLFADWNGRITRSTNWSANSTCAWKFTYVGTTYKRNDVPGVPGTPGDEPVGPVTDLADADPTKCYSIVTNGRGAWAVSAAGSVFSSTSTEGLDIDAADARQQFAILSANGTDYYLYSVSAKKFVTREGTLVPFTGDAIALADASSIETGRVQVRFRDYSDAYINLGNQGQMTIDSWGTIDNGNAVLIAEAGDFDAADALAILADPEGARKTYFVAQAQELLTANADNHSSQPALGQYGTGAYENLASIVNSDTATAASVEHFIAAFEASKCLPVFTIDGVNDYAAGMSIYDAGGQYLRWKATDSSDETMLWAFDMTDTIVGVTDKVVIKNLATGNLFMEVFYDVSYIRIAETSENIADDGLFLMFREEDTEYAIWASQSGVVVPSQGIFSASSTSAWKFTYAGTTYGADYELPDTPGDPIAPDTTITESCNWSGIYNVKADNINVLNEGFPALEEFEMQVVYDQEFEIYRIIKLFGYDVATLNNDGGIVLAPSETNPNQAEIATNGSYLLKDEANNAWFCLRNADLSTNPVIITRLEDGTFAIDGFSIIYNVFDGTPETPAAYYQSVTAENVYSEMPIEYVPDPSGWIEGTITYYAEEDYENFAVGYSSPMYRFHEKVETFRIEVIHDRNGRPFFSLSELEVYDSKGTKIELTAGNVRTNADHNALNPGNEDGGGIPALFDGDRETYFHSAWRNVPSQRHYLEVKLPDGGYDAFSFRMISRPREGNNNANYTFPGAMLIRNIENPQREALKELLDKASGYYPYSFPEVGYYSADLGYLREAMNEAEELFGSVASEDEYEAMVDALSKAIKEFETGGGNAVRLPESGKVYRVVSAFPGFYEHQSVEKTLSISIGDSTRTIWWEDVDTDNPLQEFVFEPILNADSVPYVENWEVRYGNGTVEIATYYPYYMKHVATGLYAGYVGGVGFRFVEEPSVVRLMPLGDGQFNIYGFEYTETGGIYIHSAHAGDHNEGYPSDSIGDYGGIFGMSSTIVPWSAGFGSASAWCIREYIELPHTEAILESRYDSEYIHFEATNVITLMADKECSFENLTLYDRYGNEIAIDTLVVSGNMATIAQKRNLVACSFAFTNREGVTSVTFDATSPAVEEPSLQLVGVTPDSETAQAWVRALTLSFNKEITVWGLGDFLRGINTGEEFLLISRHIGENSNGGFDLTLYFEDADDGWTDMITVPDTYTYTIPAGAIKSVDGEELPETTVTFTVDGTFSVANYSPTETISLEQIELTFDRVIEDITIYYGWYVENEEGDNVAYVDWGRGHGSKTVTLGLNEPITTPGKYYLHIFADAFTAEGYMPNMPTDLTFTVIEDTPVISTDYAMKAQDVKGRASNVVNIPIEMDNVTAVNAFQFDLYLPEGVSVVSTMEDDEVLYDIAFNKNRSKSSHVLAVEPQDDGALRVAGYSTSNAAFVGNSGVLVNVAVSVGDIAEGDYSVVMRNIRMVTEDELGNAVEKLGADCTATLTVENTLPGDVNSDGNITMIDVVMTVNAVLEKEQKNFNANAADLNGDGQITMVDVVGVLHLVLTESSSKAPVRRDLDRTVSMPVLNACELEFMGNGGVVLPVALCNGEDYSAFQLDVQLPTGVKLTDVELAGRAKASHTMAWNTLSDGTVRVVAYAVDNATFSNDEGALLNLVLSTSGELSADAELVLTDGLFASVDGLENRAPAVNVLMRSDATYVDGAVAGVFQVYGTEGAVVVECGADTAVSIYAVTGKLVQQAVVEAGQNTIALPDGVYIVNGNKVIVK